MNEGMAHRRDCLLEHFAHASPLLHIDGVAADVKLLKGGVSRLFAFVTFRDYQEIYDVSVEWFL